MQRTKNRHMQTRTAASSSVNTHEPCLVDSVGYSSVLTPLWLSQPSPISRGFPHSEGRELMETLNLGSLSTHSLAIGLYFCSHQLPELDSLRMTELGTKSMRIVENIIRNHFIDFFPHCKVMFGFAPGLWLSNFQFLTIQAV